MISFRIVSKGQRCLSEGPCPLSFRHPHPYSYYHHPRELTGSDMHMSKQNNSSLNMLLDSTSSMMRTVSTALKSLIGPTHRSSYCGLPDPSVQLAANGVSGSLNLHSTVASSNESFCSNTSFGEQKRTVTIYDGRIASTPIASSVPFELMTPIEAIIKAEGDPIESFVQIVLEKSDDKSPIMPSIPKSSILTNVSPRCQYRSSSPRSLSTTENLLTSKESFPVSELIERQSMPTTEALGLVEFNCQTPVDAESMDFSFREPVLQDENAVSSPVLLRNDLLSSSSNKFDNSRKISLQNEPNRGDSAVDLLMSSYSSYSSNQAASVKGYLTKVESLSGDDHTHSLLPSRQ